MRGKKRKVLNNANLKLSNSGSANDWPKQHKIEITPKPWKSSVVKEKQAMQS